MKDSNDEHYPLNYFVENSNLRVILIVNQKVLFEFFERIHIRENHHYLYKGTCKLVSKPAP